MLGMTSKELGEMTPRSFQNKVEGFNDFETSRVAIIRWQTSMLMNASGNYKKAIQPKDIMNLGEYDKPRGKVEVASPDRIKEVLKKYKLPIPKKIDEQVVK